jgi:DNA-binding NtrC family response regulator
MKEYSVLVFERESFLAEILEGILEHELRDYPLSIHTVSDFAALNKELSTQHYDVLVTDFLDWKDEDYASFRTVTEAFPNLRVVLAGNKDTAPDDIAARSNTVITPRVSTRISEAVLKMLLGNALERP